MIFEDIARTVMNAVLMGILLNCNLACLRALDSPRRNASILLVVRGMWGVRTFSISLKREKNVGRPVIRVNRILGPLSSRGRFEVTRFWSSFSDRNLCGGKHVSSDNDFGYDSSNSRLF